MNRIQSKTVVIISILAIVCSFGVSMAGAAEKPLKVALIAPSASNDLAFTQSMVDGINAIKKERKLDVAITDGAFVLEDAAASIRDYAKKGYDLVIAHSALYGGAVKEIAKEFPNTAFAWSTDDEAYGPPNVTAYGSATQEGAYVLGVMASMLSKKKMIGIVGPIEVGDAKTYIDGFTAGAKAQNSKIKVNVNYIGSFSDVALAAEAARAHLSAGADILTGTSQMVVGAIGAARAKKAAWFGTQANQTVLAPEIVVASQVYKWEVILRQMINDYDNGKLGGKRYIINIANDGLVIEFNEKLKLPENIKKAGMDTVKGIKSGSIKVMP